MEAGAGVEVERRSFEVSAEQSGLRGRLDRWARSARFQRVITTLIIINAITLGLETSRTVMAATGGFIHLLDSIILAVFVVEVLIRIGAQGWRFFTEAWNLFDFFVVGVALVPTTENFSVLRALRVLRVLRLVSIMPRMRRVVEALLSSLPGLGAVSAVLCLVFYVASVMATQLFGDAFPEWFGTLGHSLYSLFQIMTLESWSMGIVRPVMVEFPYAWAFFVPFILIATFTMLNLFIAVVVNAMQVATDVEGATVVEETHEEREALREELAALRGEVEKLLTRLDEMQPGKTRE